MKWWRKLEYTISRWFCWMGVHYWSHPGGVCIECGTRDTFFDKPDKIGWLAEYKGVCWVMGDGFESDPGFTGPFRRLKARRWADRNSVRLVPPP